MKAPSIIILKTPRRARFEDEFKAQAKSPPQRASPQKEPLKSPPVIGSLDAMVGQVERALSKRFEDKQRAANTKVRNLLKAKEERLSVTLRRKEQVLERAFQKERRELQQQRAHWAEASQRHQERLAKKEQALARKGQRQEIQIRRSGKLKLEREEAQLRARSQTQFERLVQAGLTKKIREAFAARVAQERQKVERDSEGRLQAKAQQMEGAFQRDFQAKLQKHKALIKAELHVHFAKKLKAVTDRLTARYGTLTKKKLEDYQQMNSRLLKNVEAKERRLDADALELDRYYKQKEKRLFHLYRSKEARLKQVLQARRTTFESTMAAFRAKVDSREKRLDEDAGKLESYYTQKREELSKESQAFEAQLKKTYLQKEAQMKQAIQAQEAALAQKTTQLEERESTLHQEVLKQIGAEEKRMLKLLNEKLDAKAKDFDTLFDGIQATLLDRLKSSLEGEISQIKEKITQEFHIPAKGKFDPAAILKRIFQ